MSAPSELPELALQGSADGHKSDCAILRNNRHKQHKLRICCPSICSYCLVFSAALELTTSRDTCCWSRLLFSGDICNLHLRFIFFVWFCKYVHKVLTGRNLINAKRRNIQVSRVSTVTRLETQRLRIPGSSPGKGKATGLAQVSALLSIQRVKTQPPRIRRLTAFEMWWHTGRNQISSFGETDESI